MSLFDDASLVLIPDGAKDSKLYSVKPTDGGGDFTFSRSTTATRVNESGLIESVATNVPRIDYSEGGCPSLLLEPQRTNLLTYSEEFDNVAWTKSQLNISADTTTSPDGETTADKLISTTSNSAHFMSQSITATSGNKYVASAYFKQSDSGHYGVLRFQNSTAFDTEGAILDASDGTIVDHNCEETPIVEILSNGWYRLAIIQTANASGNGQILVAETTKSVILSIAYAGDGTSGVFAWGAQLEAGSYPTSYIPTNSAAVTRNADSCELTGVADLIGDSEGTLYFEFDYFDGSDNFRISLSDGTTNNRVVFGIVSGNQYFYRVDNAGQGGFQFSSINGSSQPNTNIKVAIKYSEDDFTLYANGVEVIQVDAGNTFTSDELTDIRLDNASGGNDFYGNVKQLTVFPTALTDTQLENLTS